MTNKHNAPNQQATDGWSTYNVIAVSFDDDRNAEEAMTLLKELDAQERVVIQQAVVVERRNDGQVVEADRTESTLMLGTASGGVIGLLIGIIGGPLGMLIGGAGGLYAGALFDIHDAGEMESALAGISSSVRVGRTALLAVVTEQSADVIDTSMSGLGGTVLRRSVLDEIQNRRLERVCALLRETQQPIGEISESCGYDGPRLKVLFKQRFGMTMRDYRNSPLSFCPRNVYTIAP